MANVEIRDGKLRRKFTPQWYENSKYSESLDKEWLLKSVNARLESMVEYIEELHLIIEKKLKCNEQPNILLDKEFEKTLETTFKKSLKDKPTKKNRK